MEVCDTTYEISQSLFHDDEARLLSSSRLCPRDSEICGSAVCVHIKDTHIQTRIDLLLRYDKSPSFSGKEKYGKYGIEKEHNAGFYDESAGRAIMSERIVGRKKKKGRTFDKHGDNCRQRI